MSRSVNRWIEPGEGAPREVVALLSRARRGPDANAKARMWRAVSGAGVGLGASGAAWGAVAKHGLLHSITTKILVAVVAVGGLAALARELPNASNAAHRHSVRATSAPGTSPGVHSNSTHQAPIAVQPSASPPSSVPLRVDTPTEHTIERTTPDSPVRRPSMVEHAHNATSSSRQTEPTVADRAPIAPAADDLETEILLVATARSCLSADPAHALALIDASSAPRGSSALAHESEAIAIDALFRLHRAREAVARANRFLDAHPTSTLAPRIRALRNEADEAPRE